MGLFSQKISLDLAHSDITYYPDFISGEKSSEYFNQLKTQVPWQQDNIKVFGKIHAQPRLTALYATNGKPYSYSNLTMFPNLFTQELLDIKSLVEKEAGVVFTTCLLNYYRNGSDSNGWHADNEKELGINPIIASVSFGAGRFFHLRNNSNKQLKHKMMLEHGSLLLMQGETQHHWQHQIPKTTKDVGERINLTFRIIP